MDIGFAVYALNASVFTNTYTSHVTMESDRTSRFHMDPWFRFKPVLDPDFRLTRRCHVVCSPAQKPLPFLTTKMNQSYRINPTHPQPYGKLRTA